MHQTKKDWTIPAANIYRALKSFFWEKGHFIQCARSKGLVFGPHGVRLYQVTSNGTSIAITNAGKLFMEIYENATKIKR